jgi:hypothetical protein
MGTEAISRTLAEMRRRKCGGTLPDLPRVRAHAVRASMSEVAYKELEVSTKLPTYMSGVYVFILDQASPAIPPTSPICSVDLDNLRFSIRFILEPLVKTSLSWPLLQMLAMTCP